jgi:hypothetical protein
MLRAQDLVRVSAGQMIPGDGEVVEGVASVDESGIPGESAPVIREAGGDRSAVTGGTRVLSDEITVHITSNPGETFLDRMIALVEGAERRKTPNEIALTFCSPAPKTTSPNRMFTIGTMPPNGVKESCMEFTAPQLASVVTVAKSAGFAMPKRTSLPSMLPPA